MTDIWTFLIHTINVSCAAVFIYAIKRIFRDKLTPVWQFGVWSVLLVILILPQVTSGGFIIINWANIIEFLKTRFLGTYTLSKAFTFFPLPINFTVTNIFDIIYFVYFSGVIFFLIKYILSYNKLRKILKKADAPAKKDSSHIKNISEKYSLPLCKCVKSKEITTPFICGILSPVLVLPENEIDEKVILHELLHLKHKDVLWGVIVAVFRSIHWCNPLLWFIFNKINNDLEELCDSRVLQLLEGEARRDYGNILLSMVNEKFPCIPGTSCAANGGKNIKSRIKTIARYKQYPESSAILNICIILIICSFFLFGSRTLTMSADATENISDAEIDFNMANARNIRCYTPAGAIDTYAKAIIQNNGFYRACSAPLNEHRAIADEIKKNRDNGITPLWNSDYNLNTFNGFSYYVYNLEINEDRTYSAIIGINLLSSETEENEALIAYQRISVFRENNRWVVTPEGDISTVASSKPFFGNVCFDIPTYCYEGENDKFRVERYIQHVIEIDTLASNNKNLPAFFADFGYMWVCDSGKIIYKGEDKESITHTGYGFEYIYEGENVTLVRHHGGGSSSFDENNEKLLSGGGSGGAFNKKELILPEKVLCEININREPYEQIMLYPEEKLYD